MSKFDAVRKAETNGANYDVMFEDVLAKLEDWDARYGVTVDDVHHDRLTVRFAQLPEDIAPLAQEIYDFCPDVVEQGFGVYAEMLEVLSEYGDGPTDAQIELAQGIDFEDPDYGMELLRRSLRRDREVGLWWD